MRRQASRRARVRPLVAAVALVASACAGADGVRPAVESTTTTSTEGAASTSSTEPLPSIYGGTVVVGLADGGAPRTLNPFLEGPDAAVLDLIGPAMFAQGFDRDPSSGDRLPDAFVAVPSLEAGTLVDNGNGTVDVTLEIVDGAQWADGVPITADDLAFTYQLAVDPQQPIRNDLAALYSAIVPGSVAPDGNVLRFRMETGTDPADLFSIIVPRHEVEGSEFAVEWDDRMWVAGGPFVLTDFQPGQFVELRRNPQYWKVTAAEGAALPFLDRVIIRFYEPSDGIDARLVDAFDRAEVTVAVFGEAERRAEVFDSAVASGAELLTAPSGAWEHLNFQFGPANRNAASANASLSFRRAVAHAIDREALSEQRGTPVVDSILQRFVPDLGEMPFAQYPYDPAESERLLAGTNPPVVLTVPGDDPRALALGGDIVVMLRDAGFEAELQLEDADLFFGSTLDNGSWDVAAWRFGARTGLNGATDFIRFYDPDGLPFVGDNFFRWGTVDSRVSNNATARYRQIVDALDRAIDPTEIQSLLIEAESILADEAVLLPLVLSDDEGIGYWPALVEGVAINPAQGPLWNVDTWRVPTE